MLGAILAGASPAVIVPLMLRFIEEKRGADHGAPTLVLAGSAGDNVMAITIATALVGLYAGHTTSLAWQIGSLPLSMLTGVVAGAGLGWLLGKLFDHGCCSFGNAGT